MSRAFVGSSQSIARVDVLREAQRELDAAWWVDLEVLLAGAFDSTGTGMVRLLAILDRFSARHRHGRRLDNPRMCGSTPSGDH